MVKSGFKVCFRGLFGESAGAFVRAALVMWLFIGWGWVSVWACFSRCMTPSDSFKRCNPGSLGSKQVTVDFDYPFRNPLWRLFPAGSSRLKISGRYSGFENVSHRLPQATASSSKPKLISSIIATEPSIE